MCDCSCDEIMNDYKCSNKIKNDSIIILNRKDIKKIVNNIGEIVEFKIKRKYGKKFTRPVIKIDLK